MKIKFVLILLISQLFLLDTYSITAREVVDEIIKNTLGTPLNKTVDVFKEGNPDDQVTGIAVCMFATMEVLREAVKNKCNFIITHEPLYYNHLDATDQFKNDPVFNEKRKYILDNKLIIWRFHDYLHRAKPDRVLLAMAEKLDWKTYSKNEYYTQYQIPETTLEEVIKHLQAKIPGTSFNVVGNPSAKISNICFTPGSPGSMMHIQCFRTMNVDLVIGGEVQQWETYEYVRDAVAQGKNKAIIFMGHIPSENPGMEYTPDWLKTFITEVPIVFIDCGASYKTY